MTDRTGRVPPTCIEGVDATASVEEGRMVMRGQVSDTMYVKTPTDPPLSSRETHLSLRVDSGGMRVTLDFDGEAADALAEALAERGGDA